VRKGRPCQGQAKLNAVGGGLIAAVWFNVALGWHSFPTPAGALPLPISSSVKESLSFFPLCETGGEQEFPQMFRRGKPRVVIAAADDYLAMLQKEFPAGGAVSQSAPVAGSQSRGLQLASSFWAASPRRHRCRRPRGGDDLSPQKRQEPSSFLYRVPESGGTTRGERRTPGCCSELHKKVQIPQRAGRYTLGHAAKPKRSTVTL